MSVGSNNSEYVSAWKRPWYSVSCHHFLLYEITREKRTVTSELSLRLFTFPALHKYIALAVVDIVFPCYTTSWEQALCCCSFPDATLADAANYCRNPRGSGKISKPWCRTTNKAVEMDLCSIPKCIKECKCARWKATDGKGLINQLPIRVIFIRNMYSCAALSIRSFIHWCMHLSMYKSFIEHPVSHTLIILTSSSGGSFCK